MAPPGTMTAVPPLPPQVTAQQPPSPAASFANMAPSLPDPIQVLEGKMAELEKWAAETAPLLTQISPSLATLLTPIAQAGSAMQSEIANMKQQMSGPSPRVQGSVPPNVPGNIPGGRPGM